MATTHGDMDKQNKSYKYLLYIVFFLILVSTTSLILRFKNKLDTSKIDIKNVVGTDLEDTFSFLYGDYNNIAKYRKNIDGNIELVENGYKIYGNVILNDNTLNELARKENTTPNSLFTIIGQPVYINDNILISDGWPINEKALYIYILSSGKKLTINKTFDEEMLINVQYDDNLLYIFTDYYIYMVIDETITRINYSINTLKKDELYDEYAIDEKEYKIFDGQILFNEEYYSFSKEKNFFSSYMSKVYYLKTAQSELLFKEFIDYVVLDLFIVNENIILVGFQNNNSDIIMYKLNLDLEVVDQNVIEFPDNISDKIILSTYDECQLINDKFLYLISCGKNNNMFISTYDVNELKLINIRELNLENDKFIFECIFKE